MGYCTLRLPDSVKTQNAVDKYWHSIGEMKDLSRQECRFPTLTKLAKATIIIPHGNADNEQVFSHIGLIKHQNSLSLEMLINSLQSKSLLCIQAEQ